MMNLLKGFVPVMTSQAGLCLTAAQWQEVKIHAGAWFLDVLLIKPGYELLKQVVEIKKQFAWSGELVLNAMNLIPNKAGECYLISPYDGSQFKLTWRQCLEVIHSLQPDAVILPEKMAISYSDMWSTWPKHIFPFIAVQELDKSPVHRPYGVYFKCDESTVLLDVLEQIKPFSHLPLYFSGQLSDELLQALLHRNIGLIESDEPARLAVSGQLYTHSGGMNVLDKVNELAFDPIDEMCQCPACSQGLTKAYLHHLLQHTPLLCQRLLVQHNIAAVCRAVANSP